MINPKLLMSAQQAVASAFVDDGVKVVWDAKTPWADLDNRVVHLRPMPEKVMERDLLDVRADCDHELAHFIYTDPEVVRAVDRPMVLLLLNAIEDGFIERMHSEHYLGVAENLRESNAHYIREIGKTAQNTTASRRQRAVAALTMLSRGFTRSEVSQALGGPLSYIDTISDLLPRISRVSSTAESASLAEQIADKWRWDSDRDVGDDDAITTDAIDLAGEGKLAAKLSGMTLGAIRKRVISDIEFSRSGVYCAQTVNDVIEDIPEPTSDTWDTDFAHHELMASVRQIAGPLRRKLLMEFRGPGVSISRHQRRGKVDQRSLHKVPMQDPNVFLAETKDAVIDCDVTLMVDCSGSMTFADIKDGDIINTMLDVRKATPLWKAAQAACACALVLDLIGVSNEVLAWTTGAFQKEDQNFDRVSPLRNMIVKAAGKSFHSSQRNFVKLALLDHALDNVDGESILWGATRLATRARQTNKRPLLIVFSDGEPAATSEDRRVLNKHLKESIKRITEAGIATIGVGINTTTVKKFYPKWTVVRDLNDLVSRFYKLLRVELRNSKKLS